MKSSNLKQPKINNSNRLLFEEIARKSKSKTGEKSSKIPRTPNLTNNKIPVSPYFQSSPRLRSPTVPKTPRTPKTPNNKTLSSPYHRYLQSPKTPKSLFEAKSPYKPDSPYRTKSPYVTKKDPWIYNSTQNEKHSKIIGIDENGNLCKIPTVDYELKQTNRSIIEETDGSDDYILIGDIFLDQKNSKGRDYNYVSQNMRDIALRTNDLRSLYANKFKPFDKNIKGEVSLEKYEDLLEIYENNQVYYQDCIENGSLTYDQLCTCLTELEYWFICIIEPYDYSDYDVDEHAEWKTREQFKVNKGYSGYCDPELYFYIQQPLLQETINFINNKHKKVFRC